MKTAFEVVILAAGKGTRMQSHLPKVLHPLAGKPLLHHLLGTVQSLQPLNIYGVCSHEAELVKASTQDFPITWIDQGEPLGTGHAVKQTLDYLTAERILILMGDTPLVSAHSLKNLLALPDETLGILTAILDNPTGLGRIVRDEAHQITAIVEERDATPAQKALREINTGMMIVPRVKLIEWLKQIHPHNAQGEYYLTDLVSLAFQEDYPIQGVMLSDLLEASSINDRLQLAEAERRLQAKLAEDLMRKGVTLLDPSRLDIRGEIVAEKDVILDANVILEGKVELGEGCQVGPFVILKNVVLGPGVIIKSHCHIEGAIIGARCEIGPFARIRPQTVLENQVKIGNFVEIKKSTVGKSSKVNHLTYLGDAEVGEQVNVGAGVITANYDGVNKWKTTIDDEASIGANVVLVAPVTVGKAATIGAGSVITREAPAEQLTVARAKQQTVGLWKKDKFSKIDQI